MKFIKCSHLMGLSKDEELICATLDWNQHINVYIKTSFVMAYLIERCVCNNNYVQSSILVKLVSNCIALCSTVTTGKQIIVFIENVFLQIQSYLYHNMCFTRTVNFKHFQENMKGFNQIPQVAPRMQQIRVILTRLFIIFFFSTTKLNSVLCMFCHVKLPQQQQKRVSVLSCVENVS